MTEEEYDLKNAKLAKRRKHLLGFSILVFVLTSFYVAPFIGSIGFLIKTLVSFLLGVILATNFIGTRLTIQTSLQWIFSFSTSSVISAFLSLSIRYIDMDFNEERKGVFTLILLAINSVSFAFSIGLGTFVSFNDEVERIAKLIHFSSPEKRNILSIQDSETNQN